MNDEQKKQEVEQVAPAFAEASVGREVEEVAKEVRCQKCEEYLAGWKRALADYDNLQKDLGRVRNRAGFYQSCPVLAHLRL